MRISVCLLGIILGLATANEAVGQVASQSSTPDVSAVGVAEVLVPAGRALLVISWSVGGSDGQDATVASIEQMEQVAMTLLNLGLEPVPLGGAMGENQQVMRAPSSQVSELPSFVSRSAIAAEIRDLSRVAEVTREIAAEGFRGSLAVTYYADESHSVFESAVSEATRMARRRAEQMAAAAGGSLGDLIRIQNPGSGSGVSGLSRLPTNDLSGVPFVTGEVLVRVSVQAWWRFIP